MTTLPALQNATALVAPTAEEIEAGAVHMAREFRQATAEIARLMLAIQTQTARLRDAFNTDDGAIYSSSFALDFEYNGRGHRADDPRPIFTEMKRRAWRTLVVRLGIINVMSVAKRAEFDKQMSKGELPDINEETIVSLILGLVGQAQEFARDAAKEVFDILRPRGAWSGHYKTNDAFRVGRKVILSWYVERGYGKPFRVNYHKEQQVTAIDGIFHLLDGKGVMREHRGPLYQAINDSPNGQGETAYFRFKCFKNGNLHLEMKRLDLVKQLNGLAAGEYVLGDDAD